MAKCIHCGKPVIASENHVQDENGRCVSVVYTRGVPANAVVTAEDKGHEFHGNQYTGPEILPFKPDSIDAAKFPHIPLSKALYYLIGSAGEYGFYESKNERMGGRKFKVLHHPTGWMSIAPDKTTASKMVERHANSLKGVPPNYNHPTGWGEQGFKWKSENWAKSSDAQGGEAIVTAEEAGQTPLDIGGLTSLATAVKLAHWNADTTTTEHGALGELYEAVEAGTDRFVEAWLGKHKGKVVSEVTLELAGKSLGEVCDAGTAAVAVLRGKLAAGEDEDLLNILAELDEALNKARYILKAKEAGMDTMVKATWSDAAREAAKRAIHEKSVSHVIYDDGRPGHQGVVGKVLHRDEYGMHVQFEDRASPTRIGYHQDEWMKHIKPHIKAKGEDMSEQGKVTAASPVVCTSGFPLVW